MQSWLIIQSFFHGLHRATQEHLDAAAGGSFLSLSDTTAREIIDKMTISQWKEERPASTRTRCVHQVDGMDMLATKMDLLLKKMDDNPSCEAV